MPVRNDSGHDVEIDVEEGEPPPTNPGVISVPVNVQVASIAFTFIGGASAIIGCLPGVTSPFATMIGVAALGVAIGIQGYALATGRRVVAPKRLVFSGDGGKLPLKPGETMPYAFKPGDCVVFCWKNEAGGTESMTSAPVLSSGSLVELIELTGQRVGPGGSTHAILIHV